MLIAPEHPGSGESQGLEHLEDLWDLVLYYNELLDALGVERATVVGHSFGGMVAAELAANNPERVDTAGAHRPASACGATSTPSPTSPASRPTQLPGLVLADPTGPLAAMLPAPDPTTPTRCSGVARRSPRILQFIWPLPDKGLSSASTG